MTTSPYRYEDAWPTAGCPVHPEAVPLGGLRYQQTPAEVYREMRRSHGPVIPILLEGGIPAWLVVGYRELHHVTSNDQLFARDSRRWNAWGSIPPNWPLLPFVGYQPSVLFSEGAEHRRRAGAISDALSQIDQFELQAHCEHIADKLINGFAGSGEADLMAGYANPLPLLAALWMCGVRNAELSHLVHDLTACLDTDEAEDPIGAYRRLQEQVHWLVLGKRKAPGADVPSHLLAHSARLADEEIVQDLTTVILAAQQPTANWIGNTLRLMLTDDRFATSLAGGRCSVAQALNEVLWEDTPTQNFIGRWAVRDTQLGGRRIREGDCLVLGLAAANADPQIRPDAYAGAAGNHAHMSFSHGEHQCPCPAPELAEAIARTAVEVLLDRLPDITLTVDAKDLVWRPSLWIRGLAALPVAFSPAYAVAATP